MGATVGDALAVGVADGDGFGVPLSVELGVAVDDGVMVGVSVGVAVGIGVGVVPGKLMSRLAETAEAEAAPCSTLARIRVEKFPTPNVEPAPSQESVREAPETNRPLWYPTS